MSKTPIFDSKVKAILDATQPGERVCEMTGEKWMMDAEEISWYKKFNVPPSPFSPRVRMWHMTNFFAVYQWWWNKHPETGAPVLSYVHPASKIKVLPDKEWFEREMADYGRAIDSSRSFLDQFRALQLDVPINATRNFVDPENSIATVSLGDRNGYFVSASQSEDSFYLLDTQFGTRTMDANGGINVTDSYHINHSLRLHGCQFIYESRDCMSSSFLFDCRNCEFCFGAANKRNRKYVWFNEQLNKEEWERRRAEVDLGSYAQMTATFDRFTKLIREEAIWPQNFNEGSEDCLGDYLIKCSDLQHCLYGIDSHGGYFCYGLYNGNDNAFSCAIPGEHNYQSGPVGNTSNSRFSCTLVRCDNLEYSMNCYDCTDCFGCVGLRKKQFHIFNKAYAEEEYWKVLDEIKCAMLEHDEYGRPFPINFGFNYYPDSGPVMYFGATIEDWDVVGRDHFEASADGAFGTLSLDDPRMREVDQLPDHIRDLDDDWIGKPIADRAINRPFALTKAEVNYLKKFNLAAPRRHFTARMLDLFYSMSSGPFIEQTCFSCAKQVVMATNRAYPERKVYCNVCYLKYLEVHG
ncbi:MAG: hypothetical protein AAB337_01805 [Patescibacteria group bacterium]